MLIEQLKEGQQILELIKVAENSIKNLEKLKEKRENAKGKYNDGQYWLTITEHNDGSGCRAELNRHFGNAELLDMIIDKLEEQLKDLSDRFAEL